MGDAQALQPRSGGGFVIAQRRQRRRGFGLCGGGEADQSRQVGDLGLGFLQALGRLGQIALGIGKPRASTAAWRGGYGRTGW